VNAGFYWVTFQKLRIPAALVVEHTPLREKPMLTWVLPGMCSGIDPDQISDPVPCVEPEREPTEEQTERVVCPMCNKMIGLEKEAPDCFRCTC